MSKSKKKETAIVLSKVQVEHHLETAEANGAQLLRGFADVLSADLSPGQLAHVLSTLRDLKNTIDKGLEPTVKTRLVTLLTEKGQQVTDKGSREFVAEGWKVSMKPYRTGIDPKKLESLLRSMELDPAHYMHTEIHYKVSEDGLKKLIDKKKLSQEELESCNYEVSWTLNPPEKL